MMARQFLFFFLVPFLLTSRTSDSAKLCRKDMKGEVRFCEKQKSGAEIDGHQVTVRSASVGGGFRKTAEFEVDYLEPGPNPQHWAPSPPPPAVLPSSPPPPSTNSTPPVAAPPPPTPKEG